MFVPHKSYHHEFHITALLCFLFLCADKVEDFPQCRAHNQTPEFVTAQKPEVGSTAWRSSGAPNPTTCACIYLLWVCASVCLCTSVCIFLCARLCICVCMCVHPCVCTSVCICVCISVCLFVRSRCICMCACLCVLMSASAQGCAHCECVHSLFKLFCALSEGDSDPGEVTSQRLS